MPSVPPDPHVDQWVDILDFTPGLYNNTYISGVPNAIVPAPAGSANAQTTSNCMAYPNGGIGPLPKATKLGVFNKTATMAGFSHLYLVGMINTPTISGTQLLVMVEAQNTTTHLFVVKSYIPTTTTWHNVHLSKFAQAPTTGFFGCPYPVMTRMSATPLTKPGQPTIVFPYAATGDTHHTAGHLYIFPEILTPHAWTLQDLIVPTHTSFSSVTGQVIAHQGRVIVLAGINYPWPIGGFSTNEQICFTTPSNSATYKFQQEILVPEFPYGYGGAGSISASELFLIKKRGGGVVVTGDINTPTVTFLPGVQPTGDLYGHAGATPAGLFYCTDKEGAWFWNGGNLAQKISPQLDDNFYSVINPVPRQNNLKYFAQAWGEWVMFSGGWVYNTRTGSWWKISYPTFFHFTPTISSNAMFAGIMTLHAFTTHFAWKVTKTVAVTSWRWVSLPFKLTENRYVNIRELVLYASNPNITTTSIFTIKLKYMDPAGTVVTVSFTSTTLALTNQPELLRFNVGISSAQNLIVDITGRATGGKPAPILHQISFGLKTRQHLRVQ